MNFFLFSFFSRWQTRARIDTQYVSANGFSVVIGTTTTSRKKPSNGCDMCDVAYLASKAQPHYIQLTAFELFGKIYFFSRSRSHTHGSMAQWHTHAAEHIKSVADRNCYKILRSINQNRRMGEKGTELYTSNASDDDTDTPDSYTFARISSPAKSYRSDNEREKNGAENEKNGWTFFFFSSPISFISFDWFDSVGIFMACHIFICQRVKWETKDGNLGADKRISLGHLCRCGLAAGESDSTRTNDSYVQ